MRRNWVAVVVACGLGCGVAGTLAQQTNPGLVTGGAGTQAEEDRKSELDGRAAAARAAARLTESGMPAAAVRGALHSDLSTRNAKVGQEVEVTLREAAAIPDGLLLPKGTKVKGHVVQVAAHSKATPNGGLLLLFDKAEMKGNEEVPVFALIRAIAPSAEAQRTSNGMLHEGQIGASSNSPEAPNMRGGAGSAVLGQSAQVSGIPGVMLVASAGGSGVLVSRNENMELEASTQMTLVVGRSSGPGATQRAYGLLASGNGPVSAGKGLGGPGKLPDVQPNPATGVPAAGQKMPPQ